MRKSAILFVALAAITVMGVSAFATCEQEPSLPSIFCVTPEIPVAKQITSFEITNLISPVNVLWDFGDGTRTSTLSTRRVDHIFVQPGQYVVKAFIAHSGGFEGITQRVTIAPDEPTFVPTPITSFDEDRNRRIDNDEFFKALDMWIANRLRDISFFEVLDAWLGQTLVVEVRGFGSTSVSTRLHSYAVYTLNGRLIQNAACSGAQLQMESRHLINKKLSRGTYLVVDRDCATGAVTKRFAQVR